jgi:hypothetical protein
VLTNDDRIDEMHKRVNALQNARRDRITRITGITAAAVCAGVIIAVGAVMPGWTEEVLLPSGESMRASMFSNSPALGYIIIGLLGFSLGIVFTAFCFRLKKWQDGKQADKQEGLDDRDD